MELKATKSAHISINSQGKVVIEQWSDDLNKPVTIYLTRDQLQQIDMWLFRNAEEIEAAWNDGVV